MASYDFYVDSSASENGDGSKDDPFETISEAIEEASEEGGTQKIFLESGTYSEDIVIEKKIRIYGKSEGSVTISGDVEMKDQTLIRNLTIQGGRGVEVASGANADIENCTIEDFDGIGIETIAGGGLLRVINSKIKNGNGKGLYIQRGKTVEIRNNEIKNNRGEEGIDLRSKIKGVIERNIIIDNGESGIEVIVGSANLKISNNTIKGNGSSGIATQFYSEDRVGSNEFGKIQILGNSIKNNKKYGVDCNMPHGGSVSKDYWKNSITLIGNEILGNDAGEINSICVLSNLIEEKKLASSKEEKPNNMQADSSQNQINQTEKKESEEEKKQKEEETRRQEQAKVELEKKKNELRKTIENGEQFGKEIEDIINEIEGENRLIFFFIGIEKEKQEKLDFLIGQKEKEIEVASTLLEIGFLQSDEEKSFRGELEKLSKGKEDLARRIEEKRGVFNLKDFFISLTRKTISF